MKKLYDPRDVFRVDRRPTAIESCDACGHTTVCTRSFCPECGIVCSTCARCDEETGGRARPWQLEAHRKRAHGPVAKFRVTVRR